jgi:hypothetical protein
LVRNLRARRSKQAVVVSVQLMRAASCPDARAGRPRCRDAVGLGVLQRSLDAGQHGFLLGFDEFLVAFLGQHDVPRAVVLDDMNRATGERFIDRGHAA